MPIDEPTDCLAEVSSRLDALNAAVDRLVASDDSEVSYAATTAALHLHAAHADLPAPTRAEHLPSRTPRDEAHPRETADTLADIATLLNDAVASLPVAQQAPAARVAIHVAEARDALRGTST